VAPLPQTAVFAERQDGDVIDILVPPRRDRRAAERSFRKLVKGQGREPRRLVTDKPTRQLRARAFVVWNAVTCA